ncbi:MAG: EAL domain-containing protein [Pseudomonadales bacterium]|jgi:diguanylate cyclase (GGDEF)-like protein/PAS domain S-box-containing protein|nr:EAL domain-containing protein [Pseudomonadales bacterium]
MPVQESREIVTDHWGELLLVFLLYSLINLQAAVPSLVVEQSDFSADLSPYVEVYEDPSASLTVSEVSEKYKSGQFFRPENGRLSFGLSSSTYWFRFAVDARIQSDYPMLLDVGNRLLQKAQLYKVKQGEQTTFQMMKGPPAGRNVAFGLDPIRAPTTYYIEVRSDAPLRTPLTLSSPAQYRSKIIAEYLVLGVFYGICFGLGIFNLFLYLSTREKSYLSYVLFVASTFAYNLTVDGFVTIKWLDARFTVVTLIALQVSAIAQLVRNFFELHSQDPWLDHLCRATSIGALLMIPLAWVFGADAFIGPVHIFLLPAGLLLLLVSLKRLRAGFKPAIYFLVAWLGLIAIVIALTLDVLGVISFEYSAYGLKIGILSQLLLFSFALGGRLNDLNKTLGGEIKQRTANELALRESEKRWRGLSEAAFEGILIFENGVIKEINHSMRDMIGGFSASLIGSDGVQLLAPECVTTAQDWVAAGASEPIELQLRRQDGTQFYVELNIRTDLADGEGGAGIQVVVVRDVTQQKSHEDKLRKMAQYDALTSLPNRVLFNERLGHAVTAAKRKDKQHAVLFIDLDRFKNVNDSLGHSVGDELLVEVAQRLEYGTRPEDTVARLGGDEFAILLEDIDAPRVAAKVAQKIIDQLMEPVSVAGHQLVTTPSIGIALYPDNGTGVGGLLRNADTAMYRAKANGRNCYQFFTRDMDNQMLQRLKLESDIRHALQFRQFILHFQPQICFRSGQVIGAEALVRWDAGLNGIRFPGEFIGVAEETGLIVPLGEQVIEMACEQLALWNRQGIHLPHLAINLSSKQFCYANIIPSIEAILERTGVPGNQLLLEITEAAMMDDEKRAIGVMNKLKGMGIQLAIDDFGTGYSSLSYLKNFPLDELKIDRSFIHEMVENEADRRIVASIVDLAKHLDLRVIAEGIETLSQAELLSSMNCENMQGYLFSRPIAPDQFTELVQERRADHESRQSS